MADRRRFTWPRRTAMAVVLVAAVLAGVMVSLHPWRSDAADRGSHPASVRSLNLPGLPQASGGPAGSTTSALRLPVTADGTARAAVAAYLRARSDGDVATSYALLGPVSRHRYLSEARWADALPDLAVPTTFLVTGEVKAAAGTEVSVDVRRTPALNSFAGFVPARALEIYRAVPSGGRWRVEAAPVRVVPELISDRTAAADVAAWLQRLAACDGAGAAALQVSPDLLGDDSLPGAICATHARLRAGPAQPMAAGPQTAPFLAAYGPELGSWARLVPVTGQGQSLLVGVAPLGRSWRVFGTVPGGLD